MSRLTLVAIAAAVWCAGQQVEPTVITVYGQAVPVSAAAASVTVLTREAIENSHADNLADVLRFVPFLSLAQSGGRGGLTTITLRGGKPNFTLVMVDGVPVNDISNVLGGSYDFSTMSTDNIEQVEIVRGPLSSVYGSDAVAGVINIIPRRGEGNSSFEIGGMLGNFTTREIGGVAAGKIRNFDYALGGSYLAMGEQVEKDPFRLGTVSLNSHVTFGTGELLHFLVRYQNSHAAGFPTNGGGPEYSILRDAQSVGTGELVTGAGWKQQVNPLWLYALDFDIFDRTQRSDVPGILDAVKPTFRSVPSIHSDTDFKRLRLAFSNTVRIGSKLTADFGIGWRREQGSSTGLIAGKIPDVFELTRSTGDANGELLYRSGRLTASFGLRADKSEGFRTVYSPRAGVSYRVTERGPRLKASWGRGFKLPSFFALADRSVGNPQLKPEFSRSFDIGIENEFFKGHLRAGLTVFRNNYRDLVDFSAQIFRLVNRSDAQTQGVEFAVAVPVSQRVQFGVNASYLDWQLKHVTEPLRDVPHWQAGASVNWKTTGRWQSRAETAWVGRRYDFQVPVSGQQAAGGYSTTNLVTSYDFSSKLSGFVRVDNLFDRRYHEFIGFPSPGVYGRLGLRYRFR